MEYNRTEVKKMPVAKKNLWLNADKTEILESEPTDRGFTLAVEGAALSDEDIERYKIPKKYWSDEPEPEVIEIEAPAKKSKK